MHAYVHTQGMWRPTVALTDPNAGGAGFPPLLYQQYVNTFLRTGNKVKSMPPASLQIKMNCQDDHNLDSARESLSLVLKATTERCGSHCARSQTHFLPSSLGTSRGVCPPHTDSATVCVSPPPPPPPPKPLSDPIKYHAILKSSKFWLALIHWIIQCKLVYSIRLDLEIQ